jgi:hypothetical protein
MGHPSPLPGGTQVEIVVPVRNEERELTDHVTRLLGYLYASFPCSWLVTVADLRGIWRLRWGLLTGSLRVPALGGARPMLLDQTIGGSAR